MTSQERAKTELIRMRSTLAKWLSMRRANDEVATGTRTGAYPPEIAVRILEANRDLDLENRLATELKALLSAAYDPAVIPFDLMDAPELADIIVTGRLPTTAASAQPQGFPAIFVLLPIILLGAGFIISRTISSLGEYAYQKEKGIACRENPNSSACGNPWWIKWAVIGGAAWLLFRHEIGGAVKSARARLKG